MKLVVAGHVTHDRRGDAIVPGGSAWYAARAWRAAGETPSMVSCVGDDFLHDAALEGLGAIVRRGGETTLFTNLYPPDGGRRIQRAEAVAPAVLPPAGLSADLLLLAPVLGEVPIDAWRATPAGTLAVGLQGWLKRRVGDRVEPRPDLLDPGTFAGVDVACVSEEDVGGDRGWVDALCAVVPVVAFTHGRAGCEVHARGRVTGVPVDPVDAPDPTGAGDTFAAVFALRLALGAPPEAAARAACDAARALVLASRAC